MKKALSTLIYVILSVCLFSYSYGQCPQVRNVNTGAWVSGGGSVGIQSSCMTVGAPLNSVLHRIFLRQPDGTNAVNPSNIQQVIINWGDGSTQTFNPPFATGTPPGSGNVRPMLSHAYAARGIYNFTVTIIPVASACNTGNVVVTGQFIHDYLTIPGIGFASPPASSANKRCVPEALTFKNVSTGMNFLDQFIITWGDNNSDTVDYTSVNQDITHTYLPGTTGCRIMVRITYRNKVCQLPPNTGSPLANFGEYFFLDIDTAQVTPADIILCDPTDVTIDDNSILNCLDTSGRRIRWEATQGFSGPLPLPGNNVFRSYNIAANRRLNIPQSLLIPIPNDSTYRYRMTLRNQCGDDDVTGVIRIVSPKTPVFAVLNNNPCPGSPMNFTNTTPNPSGIQQYEWNWGDGVVEMRSGANVSHTYQLGGSYNVTLTTIIRGYNNQECRRSRTIPVIVQRTASPVIITTPIVGCDTLTVRIRNNSRNLQNGVSWQGWEIGRAWGGSGNIMSYPAGTLIPTAPGPEAAVAQVLSSRTAPDTSARVRFKTYGRYIISLRANSGACPVFSDRDTVDIYPSPQIRWQIKDTSVCLGQSIELRDSSRVMQTQRRDLDNTWNDIVWTLNMGDGQSFDNIGSPITSNFDNMNNRLRFHTYALPGIYTVVLRVYTPNGCLVSQTKRVRVTNVAAPSFTFVQDACNPQIITFKNTSITTEITKYRYQIRRGGSPFRVISMNAIRDTTTILPYVFPSGGTDYQVVLEAITFGGNDSCVVSTAPILINVPPTLINSIGVSPTDRGCSPLNNIVFINNSVNVPPNYVYNWRFTNGNVANNTFSPPAQNFINNTALVRYDTAFLSIVGPNNCIFRSFKEITVFPNPAVQIQAPIRVCNGQQVLITATGNGLGTYVWTIGPTVFATPTVNYTFINNSVSPIAVNIRLDAVTNGNCAGSDVRTVIVLPDPSANLFIPILEVCSGDTLYFDGSASGNVAKYSWQFSDGVQYLDTLLPKVKRVFPNNNSNGLQTYSVLMSVRTADNCRRTAPLRTVAVRPNIQSKFVLDNDRGCSPLTVVFTNISSSLSVFGSTYDWYYKPLRPRTNSLGVPNSGTVLPGNKYSITFPDNNSWTGSDSVAAYIVSLIARGQGGVCPDTISDTVYVLPSPRAQYTFVTPNGLCSPMAVNFNASTSLGAVRYIWNYGPGWAPDTTNSAIFSKTLSVRRSVIDSVFNVSLTVINASGCKATTIRQINIKPRVRADFSITPPIGCSALVVNFTNTFPGPPGEVFQWQVSLGNTSSFGNFFIGTSPPPQLYYGMSATDTTRYYVRLRVLGTGSVCVAESPIRQIKVLPIPKADSMRVLPEDGCAPLSATFSAMGISAVSRFKWYIKPAAQISYSSVPDYNVAVPTPFTHVFQNNTLNTLAYKVKIVVTGLSGCLDSAEREIQVYPQINVAFNRDTAGCGPFSMTFRRTTPAGAANVFQWFVDGVPQAGSPTQMQYSFPQAAGSMPIRYIVSMRAWNSFSPQCVAQDIDTVFVYPTPRINFSVSYLPITQCSPVRVRFVYLNHSGAVRYRWQFSTNPADTLSTTSDTAITRTFTNLTTNVASNLITVKAFSSKGCVDIASQSITINPNVNAVFTAAPRLGCSPLTVNFNASASSPGADRLRWFINNVAFSSYNDERIFSHEFENFGTTPLKFAVRLLAFNVAVPACTSQTTDTITVLPYPRAAGITISPTDGCSPLTTSLSAAVVQNAVRFRWYIKLATQPAYNTLPDYDRTSSAAFNHILVNNTTGNLIYKIKTLVTGTFGCLDSVEREITVYPAVSVAFDKDTAGCGPFSMSFRRSSPAGASNVFQWFVDGVPQPASPTQMQYTFPQNAGNAPIIYSVLLKSWNAFSPACVAQETDTVIVYPTPRINFSVSYDPISQCSPSKVRFTYLTHSGAVRYRWQFSSDPADTLRTNSDTAITRTYNNTGLVSVSYPVTVIAYSVNGCIAVTTQNLLIHPNITAAFTLVPRRGCSPILVGFNALATSPAANRLRWFFDNVSMPNYDNQRQFDHVFDNNTNQIQKVVVRLQAFISSSPGCISQAIDTLYILPKPSAGILTAQPGQACSPARIEFTLQNNSPASYYIWDFGDASALDTSTTSVNSHTYFNFGTTELQNRIASVILVNSYGCRDTVKVSLSVWPLTRALIDSVPPGCAPYTYTFNNLSVNANSYIWNFGDGSAASTSRYPVHVFYNNSGKDTSYRVRLIAKNLLTPCADTTYRLVKVFSQLAPEIFINKFPEAGCSPLSVNIFKLPENPDQTIPDSISWVISNNQSARVSRFTNLIQIDTVLVNTSSQPMSVRVELNAFIVKRENGAVIRCSSRKVVFFDVYPQITANFKVDSIGCSPHVARFNNLSINPGGTYEWNFGDGGSPSFQTNPIHTYTYDGPGTDTTFLVSLIAQSPYNAECNVIDTMTMHIYAKPAPVFDIVPTTIQLPDNVITVINRTPLRKNWQYVWTFGDGGQRTDTAASFSYTYANLDTAFRDTTFTVRLKVIGLGGCDSTVIRKHVIKPLPPEAIFDSSREGCSPLAVRFYNRSKFANYYEWNFGDNSARSNEFSPLHVYNLPGSYTVTLLVRGLGGQDIESKSEYITVYKVPQARFYVIPEPPRKIRIPEEALNGFVFDYNPTYMYEWDFGDGSPKITQANPSYKYTVPGKYTVKLRVTTPDGCTSFDSLASIIEAEYGGTILVPNVFTPSNGGPNGGRVGEGGINDVFYPFTRGVTEINLQVFNRWGELLFISNTINVGWDGYYRNQLCKQDVYVFKLEAKFADGRKETKIGDVTLLHSDR